MPRGLPYRSGAARGPWAWLRRLVLAGWLAGCLGPAIGVAQEHRTVVFWHRPPSASPWVRWDLFTHLMYHDRIPISTAGTFEPPDAAAVAQIRELQQEARRRGKKFLYSIYAPFDDAVPNLRTMLQSAALRADFVADLGDWIRLLDLDGVDFDFEYPANAAENTRVGTFFTEVRQNLGRARLITADVAFWEVQVDPSVINAQLDWVQLMDYYYRDVAMATADLRLYLDAGVAPGKLVLGVPFAGKSRAGGTDFAYHALVNHIVPFDPDRNSVVNPNNGLTYEFDGRTRTREKWRVAARDVNGTMAWTLFSDSTASDTSLAVALDEERRAGLAGLDGFERAAAHDRLYQASSCALAATADRVEGDRALLATFAYAGARWSGGNVLGPEFPDGFALPAAAQLRFDLKVVDALPEATFYLRLLDAAGRKADWYSTTLLDSTGWKRCRLARGDFTADAGFDFADVRRLRLISQLASERAATTQRVIFDNFVLLDPAAGDRPVSVDAPYRWRGAANGSWHGPLAWSDATAARTWQDGRAALLDATGEARTVELAAAVYPGDFECNATADHALVGSGGLAGAASLTKQHTGTLTIANVNRNTGTTMVRGGTLRIAPGGGLYETGAFFGSPGVTHVMVHPGARLETRDWTYGVGKALGQLRHNSYAVEVDGGTLCFTEGFAAQRGWRVGPWGATLEVVAGADFRKLAGSTASQNLIEGIDSGGTVTLGGGGTGTLEDGIGTQGSWAPTAGIRKVGTGTWTLAAPSACGGAVTVEDGTLRLACPTTGSATGRGPVTVEAGGTLAGSGRVDGTLTVKGRLTPSAIRCTDAMVLTAGSRLQAIIGPGSAAALVDSTASIACAGTLEIAFEPDHLPAAGASQVVLASTAGITGSFANATPGTRLAVGKAGTFRVNPSATRLVLDDFQPAWPTYAQWAAQAGLTAGSDDGKWADPDGDGVANVAEYLLGGGPLSATRRGASHAWMHPQGDGTRRLHLTLAAPVTLDFTEAGGTAGSLEGVRVTVEAATDLRAFTSPVVPVVPAIVPSALPAETPPGWRYHTFRLGAAGAAPPRGWMRLKLE